MNPTRARKRIRELAGAGRWELTGHAIERMVERGFLPADVLNVLVRAPVCYPSDSGRWCLEGKARAGDALTVVAELQGEVLVVTLFQGDEE